MSLFTESQIEQLIINGKSRGGDHKPVVKLVLPGTGCCWLLTELDPDNPNIAFGLCDMGMGFPELGYVSIEDISTFKGMFGWTIERDMDFEADFPVSVYVEASKLHDCIIDEPSILRQVAHRLKPPGLKP